MSDSQHDFRLHTQHSHSSHHDLHGWVKADVSSATREWKLSWLKITCTTSTRLSSWTTWVSESWHELTYMGEGKADLTLAANTKFTQLSPGPTWVSENWHELYYVWIKSCHDFCQTHRMRERERERDYNNNNNNKLDILQRISSYVRSKQTTVKWQRSMYAMTSTAFTEGPDGIHLRLKELRLISLIK